MKLALLNIRFSKKNDGHRYYKCRRCGYISNETSYCPVCRKEGRLVRLKK